MVLLTSLALVALQTASLFFRVKKEKPPLAFTHQELIQAYTSVIKVLPRIKVVKGEYDFLGLGLWQGWNLQDNNLGISMVLVYKVYLFIYWLLDFVIFKEKIFYIWMLPLLIRMLQLSFLYLSWLSLQPFKKSII